jgi:hypothetical protein
MGRSELFGSSGVTTVPLSPYNSTGHLPRPIVILSLTTVCTVKRILATLRRGRREQRHFALVESL